MAVQLMTPLLGQSPSTNSGVNSPQSSSPLAIPRVSIAVELKQAPVIDGKIINDKAWDGVPKIDGFW